MIRSLGKYQLRKTQLLGLGLFLFVALCHKFIANDDFIIGKKSGSLGFFVDRTDNATGLSALIPYDSRHLDADNRAVGPFDKQEVQSWQYRHWLGTDVLGRDVLAGIINGTYIALLVGVLTCLLSLILGGVLGIISGYFGDDSVRVGGFYLTTILILMSLCIFYLTYGSILLAGLAFLLLLLVIIVAVRTSNSHSHRGITIPFDLIIFRIIEIFKSIPGLFLILVLLALFREPHIFNVVLVLALLRWFTITRLLRAEIINVKQENYIYGARAAGLSDFSILKNYILPQALSPVLIALSFGFASAILAESTLSFLGIGLPVEQVTWGSLLRDAKDNPSMWWLALFPGLSIYAVLTLFQSIGDGLADSLQGRRNL